MSGSTRRVLLLGDERKGASRRLVEEFAAWLQQSGCSVDFVLDRETSLEARAADLVIVFGGDGSLIGAARRMGKNQRPTLGINVGRLGFLTAFEESEARVAAERALAGSLREEPRMLLHATVVDANGHESPPVLLMNDAVLSRETQGAMVTLRAWQKGDEVAAYRGDGIIVATAAGSTAYSLAAGGPVLSPDLAALVLTPLASHSLSARPIVLPAEAGIEIEVVDTAGRGFAYLQLDGQIRKQVADGWRVRLHPAVEKFRRLGAGPGDFFRALRAKFGFAGVLPAPGQS